MRSTSSLFGSMTTRYDRVSSCGFCIWSATNEDGASRLGRGILSDMVDIDVCLRDEERKRRCVTKQTGV